VYISGELDEGRSTVFIDDQDGLVGAATTISIEDATSATRIEPRLRERRIAVKRAAGRKRLRWALALTILVVLVVAGLAALGSGMFAVEDVEVVGAERTDEAALAAVVDDLEGTPVLLVDTDAAERRLEAFPWVARARVTTDFPHGATIELVERTPVVTYRAPDGKWRVLDIDGRVLEIRSKPDPAHLVITGIDLTDLPLGTFDQRLSAAATLVSALGDLRAETKSVSISVDSSDLRMLLMDGTEVRFGQAEDLITKLVRLRARLNQPDTNRVRYIDVATAEIGTG
jgi:cell division protein FtsQ